MRMMLRVTMPVEKANQAINDGSLQKLMGRTMDELKPESAYFYPSEGRRACLMVFDMKDSAQIPAIAERFFMTLNAAVTLVPVMNAEDLKKGLEAWMAMK